MANTMSSLTSKDPRDVNANRVKRLVEKGKNVCEMEKFKEFKRKEAQRPQTVGKEAQRRSTYEEF